MQHRLTILHQESIGLEKPDDKSKEDAEVATGRSSQLLLLIDKPTAKIRREPMDMATPTLIGPLSNKSKEDAEVATPRCNQQLPLIDTPTAKIRREPMDRATPTLIGPSSASDLTTSR